jgi:uncharacterized protein (TIGR02271 family)
MISSNNLASLVGATVIDSDGDKVGTVGQLYVDPTSGQPNWATVKTGLFGTSESFVPLDAADESDGDLRVPYSKDFVKDAPRIDTDGSLEEADEDKLYSYYHGESSVPSASEAAPPASGSETNAPRYEAGNTSTDDAMTRSEEQLHVGTERVESGRARLHKYVVTEDQTVTVPVSHEEVRLEREPITDANLGAATDGPAISEDEHEVVLTEERPVVQKEAVPVERVRLDTETVTENQQVNEQVRKEQIEFQDADGSSQANQ